jgi:5-methylthioribose kinase
VAHTDIFPFGEKVHTPCTVHINKNEFAFFGQIHYIAGMQIGEIYAAMKAFTEKFAKTLKKLIIIEVMLQEFISDDICQDLAIADFTGDNYAVGISALSVT